MAGEDLDGFAEDGGDGVGRDAQADEGADGRRVDGAPGAEDDDDERAEGGGGEARDGVGEDAGVLGVFGGEDRGEARVVRDGELDRRDGLLATEIYRLAQ